MFITHKGYDVDFSKRVIRRRRDCMTFSFMYTPKGIKLEPCGESMIPAYAKKWMAANCLDYIFAE